MPLDMPLEPQTEVSTKTKFAVLIDAENAQPCIVAKILAHIAGFGEIVVKRIYGDFSLQSNCSWQEIIKRESLKPIQQFPNAGYKNATDMMLIIDAMDLLHSKKFDGFCIISSDSDFTSLATRLREDFNYVWGFGEAKTPSSFKQACTQFTLTEQFRPALAKANKTASTVGANKARKIPKTEIIKAFKIAALENGWATLSVFGYTLRQLIPELKFSHYGFRNLQHFINERKDLFVLKSKAEEGDNPDEVYFRLKTDA
jgi:predicted nuclease of predicted toxin-antitoxin system